MSPVVAFAAAFRRHRQDVVGIPKRLSNLSPGRPSVPAVLSDAFRALVSILDKGSARVDLTRSRTGPDRGPGPVPEDSPDLSAVLHSWTHQSYEAKYTGGAGGDLQIAPPAKRTTRGSFFQIRPIGEPSGSWFERYSQQIQHKMFRTGREGGSGKRIGQQPRHTGIVPSYENELAQIVADLNRTAQASREVTPQNTGSLDQLLTQASRRGASDILLVSGAPVAFRVNGVLNTAPGPVLTADDTRTFLLPLLSPAQAQELQREKKRPPTCVSRVRACRTIPGKFALPARLSGGEHSSSAGEDSVRLNRCTCRATLRRFAEARQGLILVTGPTGCRGKTPRSPRFWTWVAPSATIISSPWKIRSSTCTPTAARLLSKSRSASTLRTSPIPCAASCGRRRT